MFVVQVFSSPSRDDADEWLQSLRAKNVSDAYVTEQKIKGESWYRVRFGQFSSREDAEAEALRLGFRQPWVARIR
ncbi:MAG: SPOR domain-containing protein [Ignavibacteriae bacterium]|nr:MAG: SPOR domain-containing protein [Ignavibacteriota bacterium]